jgi:hypothetical protein
MKQRKIRKKIKDIVDGNFQWCDPKSKICLKQVEAHPDKWTEGCTFQSAEEVLDDIINDLTTLREYLAS